MKVRWLVITFVFFLAACGGSSNHLTPPQPDTPSPPVTITENAVGVYRGTYAEIPHQFYAVVLPDDRYYAFEGVVDQDGSMSELWMLRTGQGKSNNGDYTAPITQYFDGDIFKLSLTAKYVPATSLNGSITFLSTGATHTFSGQALSASVLDLNSPASLSSIAGSWEAVGLFDLATGSLPYTVTITPEGEFRVAGTELQCTMATITPDTKNGFFNVKFATGAGACFSKATANSSGIAIELLMPNGMRQLFLAAVDDSQAVAYAAKR